MGYVEVHTERGEKDAKGTRIKFQYDSEGYEFRLVADVFYQAVNAFCRPDSQVALEKLGLSCVNAREASDYQKSHPDYVWMRDKSKMKQYVQTFTNAIKDTPPAIVIDPDLQGVYATTSRYANYKGNLEYLRTRSLFRINLPTDLVDGLKRAYAITPTNDVPYQSLRMLHILTLWHELTHAFIMYLSGEQVRRTPPEVSVSWNEEQRATGVGESGDYMECTIWGGSIQIDRFPDPAETPSTLITNDVIKGFNTNPYAYDPKLSIEATKNISAPATATAPIKKVTDSRNSEDSRDRLIFWNVKFKPYAA
ncbi:hypothetical protein DHEL01_v203739 [Diaporthe helianthi]|uniref:Uncharacterized protein n=1 Tax=Diaporthe helianthi TaxID=158607 RepID=A0A2P5I5W9_DIAHE|nr:hypothetical protein DHEL01_v203739 [Diaporthe helianthi]